MILKKGKYDQKTWKSLKFSTNFVSLGKIVNNCYMKYEVKYCSDF